MVDNAIGDENLASKNSQGEIKKKKKHKKVREEEFQMQDQKIIDSMKETKHKKKSKKKIKFDENGDIVREFSHQTKKKKHRNRETVNICEKGDITPTNKRKCIESGENEIVDNLKKNKSNNADNDLEIFPKKYKTEHLGCEVVEHPKKKKKKRTKNEKDTQINISHEENVSGSKKKKSKNSSDQEYECTVLLTDIKFKKSEPDEVIIPENLTSDESKKKKCKKSKLRKNIADEEMNEFKESVCSSTDSSIVFNLGQWKTASFDDNKRQDKFHRLLGGFKKDSSKPKGGLFGGLAVKVGGNNAMDKQRQEQLNKNLQAQYDSALSLKLGSTKGIGFGFEALPGTGNKFHIDAGKSASMKFND